MGRYDTLTTLREITQRSRVPPGPKRMSLSDDQLRRLARLARIALQAEETSAAAVRLNRVLGLIDEMRRVDTSGVEPMAHPQDAHSLLGQPLRVDSVTETDQRERYQAAAPAVEEGLYLVPKVIE